MPTVLGDHTYPENNIRQYVDQKVKYMNFRRDDGRREKPARRTLSPAGTPRVGQSLPTLVWVGWILH